MVLTSFLHSFGSAVQPLVLGWPALSFATRVNLCRVPGHQGGNGLFQRRPGEEEDGWGCSRLHLEARNPWAPGPGSEAWVWVSERSTGKLLGNALRRPDLGGGSPPGWVGDGDPPWCVKRCLVLKKVIEKRTLTRLFRKTKLPKVLVNFLLIFTDVFVIIDQRLEDLTHFFEVYEYRV